MSSATPDPPSSYVSSRLPSSVSPILIQNRNLEMVPLSTIWSDSPTTIVVFVRHFLCLDCQDYFKEVWSAFSKAKSEGRARGVKLVVVGCGTIKLGLSVAESFGATAAEISAGHFDLFVDQKREAYQTLGLTYGVHVTLRACCCGTIRALWQGITKCWCFPSSGDVKQNGGVFVMKQDGECHFKHIETIPNDHADVKHVLQAAGV